jgi:UDP-N-acetylmuramoyl-L-alanine---L-glutamate ligase
MLSSLENYLSPLVTGKQVAILGFAREGQSTYRALRRFFPKLHIIIIDQATELPEKANEQIKGDQNLNVFLGQASLANLVSAEVIFKSPGVSPFLTDVQDAISRGSLITSQTDIFFTLFGSQVIAVTGTKGKSTTCQVIHQVLEQAGKKTLFIGNIGAPAFEFVEKMTPDTTVVYETSSHQCEGLRHGPHIGVLLNLFVDHLDYYPSMDSYMSAKKQLFMSQKAIDLCFYNVGDQRVVELLESIPAAKHGFALESDYNTDVFIKHDQIMVGSKPLMPINEIPLLGKHNLLNVMPAILIASSMGIEHEDLRNYLQHVTPVEKRLETVGEVNGVIFIDDALATIPEATIAALDALGGKVETLMVGGFDRGQDFVALAQKIASSSIRNLILFPTTGEKIVELLGSSKDKFRFFPVKNMDDAVKISLENTQSGKIVLLSTASASFGLFADYRDRSEKLRQAILASSNATAGRN